ncbi:MAG: hypothetical protein JWR11_6060 [Mycobacterium sp.]|nr:hypothetical protein [Mycobacterium sp.]
MTPWLGNILALLRTVLTGWISAVAIFFRRLCALLRAACDRRLLPGRLSQSADSRCVPIKHPAFHKPDPLIYDQYYLMKLGLAVTWDNPDIELRHNGMTVSSSAVSPDTEYEVVARIWNGSTTAPIVGLEVQFSYLSFGIGTVSHSIGVRTTDLGVKGGPGCPAFVTIPWRTPATPGHYCLQVLFDWIDDANPLNNLGQENLTVVAAHSPAEFTFPVRNTDRSVRTLAFQVDTYQPPQPLPCDQVQRPSPRDLQRRSVEPVSERLYPALPEQVLVRHDPVAHPLPRDWHIEFSPSEVRLNPAQEVVVQASIMPPNGFKGRKRINIRAVDGTFAAGGITVEVTAD